MVSPVTVVQPVLPWDFLPGLYLPPQLPSFFLKVSANGLTRWVFGTRLRGLCRPEALGWDGNNVQMQGSVANANVDVDSKRSCQMRGCEVGIFTEHLRLRLIFIATDTRSSKTFR